MVEWLTDAGNGFWAYLILFILAAAPWLEVFLVVPLGVGVGLHPIGVALVGFVGNWIPILLICFFFNQLSAWRVKRKIRKLEAQGLSPEEATAAATKRKTSKKDERARRVWEKYGIPGLAILAPTIVGTDIAAVLALAFGSNRKWVLLWMTISLALWTILLTIGSVYGFSFLNVHG